MGSKTIKEQQGRIFPIDEFILKKFKVAANKVSITYQRVGEPTKTPTIELTDKPHPDLIEKMDQLKLYMAERIDYLDGWNFCRDNIRGEFEKTKEVIKRFNEAKDRFKVTGFINVDKDEREGVQITGSLKCKHGGSTRLDVPYIYFGEDDGFEHADDVEQICEEVTQEVYNFLILNKKYQTDVQDQSEGFDNNGGTQMDLIKQSEMESSESGLDDNGERDFVPSDDQIKEIDVDEEE